jgi:hypothetical protein
MPSPEGGELEQYDEVEFDEREPDNSGGDPGALGMAVVIIS